MACDSERKLLRIIYYGSEEGLYYPGCRLHKKFYEEEKVKQLRALITEFDHEKLFSIIRKVVKEKTAIYPELILYVLAECAKSEQLRHEALSVAEEMCTTAEYFLLFFKFAKGLSPHIGSGRSCRRFITNWYLKKNSLDLAELVGQTPSYRGWRHADLIKIAHIKSNDPATGAVLTYLSKGVKRMAEKYGSEQSAANVVSYLSKVDNFRKDRDEESVVRTIETYMLTIDHLNFIHMKSKQVWIALLRRMSVGTLLQYFHLLCKYRLFRKGRQWDQDFLTAVADVLTNANSIAQSKLQPCKVYIDLCKYQLAPKYKLELAAKDHRRLAQKAPAVSFELVQHLETLIITTYKNIIPTGLRYLIVIDNNDLQKRRCNHHQYILASQAAAAIATTFYVSEQQCDIYLQNQADIYYPGKKEIRIQELVDKLTDRVKPSNHPFGSKYALLEGLKWAATHQKEVDVFILIGSNLKFQGIETKLLEFQSKLLVPNFKIVLCSLCGINKQPVIENPNIFTVVGFDENICEVISRFAKGLF